MNNKDFQKSGKCPKCGSTDLDYQCSDAIDDMIKYPFTCCDCDHTDAEWYKLEFIGYDEIETN